MREYEMDLDGFLTLVRRCGPDFAELTPEMLLEFVDKIVVHHRAKEQGVMYQIDMLPTNPADKVLLPKKKRFTGGFYDEQQIMQLLQLTREEPMYPVILLSAFYGLRRSEVLGLKWSAVDFQSGTVTVKDTVVEYYGTVEDKESTKTKSSFRTLPLTAVMSRFLRQLKQTQQENRAFFGNTYVENDYVCTREDGAMFRPGYVSERFFKSAATMLLDCGCSLKEIQEWLGHSDISTTSNIYAHLQYKAKESMAANLSQKLKLDIR